MNQESILVVDDNCDNVELLKVLFDGEGWDVRFSEHAQEALRVLETFHPSLILMDIQLPGMDGLELTRRLRARPGFGDVIILALTAYAMKGDEQNARAAGCDGYITKPIDTRTFIEMLHRYFQPGGTPVAAVRSTGPRERFPAPNISDLIPQYLKGKLADVQRIQDALERGDFDTVRVIGHNIKGTGNGYGFPEITEIGRNLEAAAKEQTASTIRSEVKALAELLERLLNTIPRYGSPTARDGCNAR